MSEANGQPLPRGWTWAKLTDIADLTGGITKGQKYKPGTFTRVVPYLRVANVQRGFLDLTDVKTIEATKEDIEALRLQRGDILFNEGGDRDKLGRGWVWEGQLTECIHQNHVFRARLLSPDLNPKFISYWGNSFGQQWFMREGRQSVNLASINLSVLRAFPVPIAPAPEQARIVEHIEELLSDLDAGVAALERAQAKLALYRAAVLKAAVEGALTADWRKQHPAAEPASTLLTRILAERRRRWEEGQLRKFKEAGKEPPKNWKAKYKEPASPDTAGLPSLPEGWCWATSERLAWTSGYGTSEKCRETNSGLAVLRIPNIIAGNLDLGDLKYAPTEYAESDKELVNVGDLLIVRTNGSRKLIGRGAVVHASPTLRLSFASYLIRMRLIPLPPLLKWISFLWESSHVRLWIEARAATSAGQYNISLGVLQTLAIPLPPETEQEKITENLEDQLSVIEHLEADLSAKLKSAQALRQSILRHAFTGQLVPQDPNDEPAAELLKRIAAEREERVRQAASAQRTNKGLRGVRSKRKKGA